jgi:hypothetical protein
MDSRKEMTMIWCLISMAILAALLALAALTVRVPRPELSEIHPGRALRGCVAVLLLLVALGLAGLALMVGLR